MMVARYRLLRTILIVLVSLCVRVALGAETSGAWRHRCARTVHAVRHSCQQARGELLPMLCTADLCIVIADPTAATAPTLPPDRWVQTPGGWQDCAIIGGLEYCPFPADQPREVPTVFDDPVRGQCVTLRIGPDGQANLYSIGTLETICQGGSQ